MPIMCNYNSINKLYRIVVCTMTTLSNHNVDYLKGLLWIFVNLCWEPVLGVGYMFVHIFIQNTVTNERVCYKQALTKQYC